METEATGELALHVSSESAIVVGDPAAVAALFERIDVDPRTAVRVGSAVADSVAAISGATAVSLSAGGNWFQMTAESFGRLQELGAFNKATDGIVSGVIRGDKGRIDTVVGLIQSHGLNPASVANVHALAATMALRMAIKNLEDLVITLDMKLDRVLQDTRTKELGNVQGITHVLAKSYGVFEETGKITSTAWDQIATHATELAQSHMVALEHLESLTRGVSSGSFKKSLNGVKIAAGGELQHWLVLAAVCLANMERLDALEIAHAKTHDETSVASHASQIAKAKEERLERTRAKVQALADAANKAGQINAFTRVMNPFEVGQLEESLEEVHRLINSFLGYLGMPSLVGTVERRAWHESIRQLAHEVGDGLAGAAAAVSTGVASAPKALSTVVEDSVLGLAHQIQARRGPQDDSTEALELRDDGQQADHKD